MKRSLLCLIVAPFLLVSARISGAQSSLYLVVSGVDPADLHVAPATRGAAPSQQPGDTVVQFDLAARKRSAIISRPKDSLKAITVSPDGAHLVCFGKIPHDSKAGGTYAVICSASGQVEHKVSFPKSLPFFVVTAPQLLPGNQRLGFEIGRRSDQKDPETGRRQPPVYEIVTTDLEGHDAKVLRPGHLPAWSPDGRTALYTAAPVRDGAGRVTTPARLMAMDADGSHPRAVAPPNSADGCFSPDGKQITYLQLSPVRSDVMIANADGSAPRKITTVQTIYGTPRWIDNSRLVVSADPKALATVVTRPPGAPLPGGGGDAPDRPNAPDPPDDSNALFVLATDGSTTRRLLPRPGVTHFIDQTHDGVVIEFGPAQINADGELVHTKGAGDGAALIFRGTRAFIKDPSGKLVPAPDGHYAMPGGHEVLIVSGKKTMEN